MQLPRLHQPIGAERPYAGHLQRERAVSPDQARNPARHRRQNHHSGQDAINALIESDELVLIGPWRQLLQRLVRAKYARESHAQEEKHSAYIVKGVNGIARCHRPRHRNQRHARRHHSGDIQRVVFPPAEPLDQIHRRADEKQIPHEPVPHRPFALRQARRRHISTRGRNRTSMSCVIVSTHRIGHRDPGYLSHAPQNHGERDPNHSHTNPHTDQHRHHELLDIGHRHLPPYHAFAGLAHNYTTNNHAPGKTCFAGARPVAP